MVEAAAPRGEDEDSRRSEFDCGVERELEIGLVLLGWMALDADTGSLGARDRFVRGGVEVADCERDLEAERLRMLEPSSAAMTMAPLGTVGSAPRERASPPDTTTTTSFDTPSSAGITQIRFCGSAAR